MHLYSSVQLHERHAQARTSRTDGDANSDPNSSTAVLARPKAAPDSAVQNGTCTAVLLVQSPLRRPVVPGVGMPSYCSAQRQGELSGMQATGLKT